MVAFSVVLKVPDAHSPHCLSLVAEPSVVTYCPGTQTPQVAHAAAFVVVLNVPLEHAVHTRSEVALPAFETYVPLAHELLGAHAVAELASSSQEASPQSTLGRAPPGQCVPAGQGEHVMGVV